MAELMIPSIGEIPSFEQIRSELADWRNGVVIRTPNWLGDAVMAIPAILQLKRMMPEFAGLFVVAPGQRITMHKILVTSREEKAFKKDSEDKNFKESKQ